MRKVIKNSYKIMVLLGLLFYAFPILAQQANMGFFEKGNSLYNQGEYQAAIEEYLKISDNGEHSSEVYYNLGIAYYKLNQIVLRIYYYKNAILLNPQDQDIVKKLHKAQNKNAD